MCLIENLEDESNEQVDEKLPPSITKNIYTDIKHVSLNFLYKLWSNGKVVSFSKWLQRIVQKDKWTSDEYKTSKNYLEGVLHSKGVATQGFVICDINVLILSCQSKLQDGDELSCLWTEILEYLMDQKESGVLYISLDGQNRMEFAICGFKDLEYEITLRIDGKRQTGKYSDFSESVRDEIDSALFTLTIILDADIEQVVDELITSNEGEPWSQNEKRSVKFTPVSFKINEIAYDTIWVSFFKKLDKAGLVKKPYLISKKGDALFIAEYLHFIRNGNKGSSSDLDAMYKTKDENISKQLEYLKEILFWLAGNFPKQFLNKKKLKWEVLRSFLIFSQMILYKGDSQRYDKKINLEKITLSDIDDPEKFIKEVLESIEKHRSDIKQIEPSLNSKGQTVYLTKNVKPNTFMKAHKSSSSDELSLRMELYEPIFADLIDDFISRGVIKQNKRISVSQPVKDYVASEFIEDEYEKYTGRSLKVLNDDFELDHINPISKGGDNSIENLHYTSKKNNRRKGNKIID